MMQKTMRYLTLSIAIAAVVMFVPQVYGVNIDTFASPDQIVTQGGIGSTPSSISTAAAIGGERDIIAEITAGTADLEANVNDANPGVYTQSNDSGVTGTSTIVWDADTDPNTIDTNGLGGIDLTAGGATAIEVQVVSNDFPFDIIFTAWDDTTETATMATLNIPGLQSNQSFFLPFASFSLPANFADLGALRAVFDGPADMDLQIDFIQSSTPPNGNGTPEPTSLVLAICGLLGLTMSRRRRRRV